MALNTSFFYFIILWKGHADVMVDGPLEVEGLRPFGPRVASGWWLVVVEPRLPLVILSKAKDLGKNSK